MVFILNVVFFIAPSSQKTPAKYELIIRSSFVVEFNNSSPVRPLWKLVKLVHGFRKSQLDSFINIQYTLRGYSLLNPISFLTTGTELYIYDHVRMDSIFVLERDRESERERERASSSQQWHYKSH